MFRVQELTQFGAPRVPAAPPPPCGALAGVAWTRMSDDPLFAEIDLVAMGYRSRARH